MSAKDADKIYGQLWKLMIDKIRHKVEVEGVTQRAIAETLGTKQPTVNRWLRGERGKEVELRTVISIVLKLGVTMDDLARAMGENNLAILLEYFVQNKEVGKRLAEILQDGSEGKRKIESEIDFIYSRLKK
jgi:transcriptional regulator with XRE-family HTH domain